MSHLIYAHHKINLSFKLFLRHLNQIISKLNMHHFMFPIDHSIYSYVPICETDT